ncbi:mediator of DNA damage checkpoint protein 1 [Epinephelus moara]|uniref:mediator of DNA damage checkpoint protein 1 n=1 Tax=Epinephelus moara TaxID=300413 RepID=UPI00214E4987|nr:mediator of DNA damage checkpoint protein 1 [Epinephelus moara]XP_049903253.1 mediator of DNA damage checkpoint protein 1 [Epinephelus moara]
MDATQMICDSILESDEDENEEENENERGRPLAKLCILKNQHIPETELPLFLGDNVLGRDPNTCTLPLPASSISKQHATICISVYKRRGSHSEVDIEALVWDLGSMNGTRKGHLKLTPNVRYALSECDSLVVADIPCQYVSCAVDAVSAQGDMRTPVSKNSGVNARLPDASGEKVGDTSTGGKKSVNGGTKARVSLPDQGDTKKTPVRSSCLSFEQTPTQPQGSLVPESDSDSDGERGDRLRKALVSDSDSHKSGPDCSTFLSPRNTIVPESEDESPITPSSSTKNRPHRHVSFSKEETDEDVGRQQLKKKEAVAIVDDSEVEEGMVEERTALGGIKSGGSGQHVSAKQESNVSLTGEDKLPVSSLADAIPAFNMDSDTDVEREEEGVASAGPVALNTNQQADQPPNTAQFHMDSDTDVDEDDDALEKVPKSVPSSADHTKPPHVISVIQPEGITMDSDTDVDDDDAAAVSDATTEAKPTSLQSPHKADSAPSTQLKDFHLDSDTDVDEEEEKEHGTNNTCPKIDETPTRLDIKPIEPVSVPAASSGLHLDSDTDDEAIPAPASSEPLVASAVTESRQTAGAGAGLDILSDSDTDVEDNSPLVIPLAVSTLSYGLHSGSDADTDVDESSVPPAGDGVNPSKPKADSGTDVEDKEVDFGETGEGQIPNLCRENTPGLLAPLLQNCSTPVQASEGDVEDMQTQAFVSPSSGPFKLPPALRPTALSSCSDSQEGEDFVVAETQSFILQTRDRQGNPPEDHTMDPTQEFCLESSGDERGEQSSRGLSFQLGLSDSSHLQGRAQTLATESTQAFVPAEGGVNMEETQAYAAISNADRTSLENEATQAYGDDEEPAISSVMSADLALEATQPYISEPRSDSEDETDENERNSTATVETQQFPTSSTLAMAQTQPMSAFEEEEVDLEEENPISSVLQVEPRRQNEKEERDEHEKAAQPQKTHLPVAATQPMPVSDDEESDDEDSIPGPRRRKAKPLQLEEEQSQMLPNSELSLVETQPMHDGVAQTQPMATSGNEESDDEDSIPGPRKRKAKQLRIEDEQTQTLTNSELSVFATQPMEMAEDGESDEEDLIPGPRRRRAKPLQLEETQPLTSSEVTAAETQPAVIGEDRESDDEDSIPGPRKRKAKVLQIQEEETQPLTNPEASTVETQPLETKTGRQPQRRKGRQSEAGTSGTTVGGKRGTRATLREEEQQAECSEPPKRQTRGKNKALPTTRGRRGKSRPDEEGSEEEEEVEPPKRAKGKISMRQQKVNKEDEERPETARNKRAANNDLIKEQDEGRERDKLERERKEKEDQERLQAENAERSRLEWERAEKARLERERKEEEEKKRAERVQKEKEEQLERERKEKEEKERLEHEKAEREEKERLQREQEERFEKERKEQEEKERLETAKQEKEAKEKQIKEQQKNKEEEKKAKTPARSGRATRRTIAAPSTTEPEQDSTISANDDGPARRTRSRSNSSNSVSSERSTSSVSTQGNRGRGRGRGGKRTSEPPQTVIARSSNRRRTVAAESTEQDSKDIPPQGVLSRSSSINSLNSEISSCSTSSQRGGRGGRQRGRGRKTEPEPVSIPPSHSDQNLASKPTARGRKSRKAEESSNEVPHDDDEEKADSQQPSTTRGRRRANANDAEPAADKKDPTQDQECASEESTLPKKSDRGRGQEVVKSETVEAPVAPVASDRDEAKEKRKGRKRELEEEPSSSSNISKGKEKAETTEAAKEETKDDIPVQAKRKGRASTAQAKTNTQDSPTEVKVKEDSEKMEEETVEKRGRGRTSAVQKKKKEEQEESGASVDQDPHVEASEPKTPTSSASRKRQAPANTSPVAKTPRSSSASPAAGGRLRVASQAYKVLFTGVVDEDGERVLARLGGSIAKGVADMNCLVTDKVRRTVKFLCAVAKGVPIVTTQWLDKSGKVGSFLPPKAFLVKDPEQEKKFNFCLQESLGTAGRQPLLQGYEIHVTKSVKPEPVQMKDIISCSGATFLPKMPSSHKPQTVVISCEEDWSLCGPALSASLPVVTAEFILTGILQQKVDLQTHTLSAPTNAQQPAGGKGRSRKKT